MKIKTTPKSQKTIPKTYTQLVLVEKGTEKLVEKNNTTELHIVVGKFGEVTPRKFRILLRTIVQTAKKYNVHKLAVDTESLNFKKLSIYDQMWFFSTIAENLILADYTYTTYKSKAPKEILSEILLVGKVTKTELTGLKRGTTIATYANITRNIANTPGGDMTPVLLAKEAEKAVQGTRATVTTLSLAQIKKHKMGGLIGVGQGAKDTPRFIIMEYWGAGKSKGNKNHPVVFVGKGITFDTGGLQIKPGMAMYEMHMDMSGGAAVIGAVAAAAKLGLKKNIVGLIPAAENAVSDESLRPGDVITMMSGTTVDVLHTDAEGRLVLADALHYAKKYNPKLVIDVATLTGAAAVAVGSHAHAIMTTDRKLEDRLRELGEESGDYVAPLPLWEEYDQYTKGVHGDIANIPANDTRYGGTITAASFLAHFTKGLKWAHIDMAPRMTSTPSDKLAKGASGEPVRLLVKLAETI